MIVWGLIVSCGLAMSTQAIAEEQDVTVSLEILETAGTTLWDSGETGISFGQLVPGAVRQKEESQNGEGALGLEVSPETNVYVRFSHKANDFASDEHTIPINNVEWAMFNDLDEAVPLSNTSVKIADVPNDSTQWIWYWMSIPDEQPSGTYGASFNYVSQSVAPPED